MEKKAMMYKIIISLIIGLIVIGIIYYFLFQEYFTKDEINYQTCMDSLILRDSIPQQGSIGGKLTIGKIREKFPLKCKTEVINLDTTNGEVIKKTIADNLVNCWALTKRGEGKLFPKNIVYARRDAIVCARIHFSDKTLEHFKENSVFNIMHYIYSHDLEGNTVEREKYSDDNNKILSARWNRMLTYQDYLYMPFTDSFEWVNDDDLEKIKNDESSGETIDRYYFGSRSKIDITDGDLLIGVHFYSNPTIFDNRYWKSYELQYPFYFQQGIDDWSNGNDGVECEIASIPA